MTRCPCTKSICRPGTSFFYKVLSSLKQLQSHKKYTNGAGLDDITKFMDKTYNLTGDIVSQVENALCAAESSKFVVRKKNLFALVCPAATLQFTPAPCVKAKLERLQQIFNSKWCECSKDTGKRKTRRSSYSPPHFIPPVKTNDAPTTTSKSNIKNCRSKAVVIKEEEKPDVKEAAESSFKSYLKSLRFYKDSFSSLKNSHSCPCPTQEPSKERTPKTPPKKESPCSTSSSKRRQGLRSWHPKKKKRVSICDDNKAPKSDMASHCPSHTSLYGKTLCSDESDSESSEC